MKGQFFFRDCSTPTREGLYEAYLDRYWVVEKSTGLPLFYRTGPKEPLIPQCNVSRDLIWQIANSMHKNYPAPVKIKKLKVVMVPVDRRHL